MTRNARCRARRNASIIRISSITASLTPLPLGARQIDCTTKASEPRTFSPISTRVSSFLNSEPAPYRRAAEALGDLFASCGFGISAEEQRVWAMLARSLLIVPPRSLLE